MPIQKRKLPLLQKLLLAETDEEHPLTLEEIIRELGRQGVTAERKSLYHDLEVLRDCGLDVICTRRDGHTVYFVGDRDFQMPELKLLVDAVQSSRFITSRKSRSLIKKLELLAGKHDAGKLQRQVYVAGRVKTENESIYYSIDNIHRAIQENRQIAFQYLDWNLKKELVPRPNGEKKVSPWALIWQDENYYLAAYDSASGVMKHYRVDKMGRVEVLREAREGMEQFAQVDLAVYTNQVFGMYGGDEEMVTLQFPGRLIGVVLDRFGRETDVRPMGDGTFRIRARVTVSGQFFGWLAGIGREACVAAPAHVRQRYLAWVEDIVRSMASGPAEEGKAVQD